MSIIYTDGSYQISIQHGRGVLTNGAKTTRFPLRSPASEIPAGHITALRKQGANPADYFFVGTPGDGALLRRAALPAWEAAVATEKARKYAEKAAKDAQIAAEVATQGQKALMFWDGNLKAALVIVRPATFAEKAGLAEWYAVGLYTELSSIAIDHDSAGPLFHEFRLHETQGNDKRTRAQESCIWFITDAQWDAFIAADRQALADRTEEWLEEKLAAKRAESDRLNAALMEAAHTGQPVEIERHMTECDGTQPDCSFDLIRRLITGSGNIITTRTHCH